MDLVQLVVIGLIVGSVIGLVAMGLTLTFGVLKFANFAHGDMMTLGMFLAFFVVGDLGMAGPRLSPFSIPLGIIPGVILAGVGVALVAASLDRLIYRRLRKRGSALITMAIASLGLAIMIRAVVQLVWGTLPKRYVS